MFTFVCILSVLLYVVNTSFDKWIHFFFQRREILNGNVEPTDSDCDWPSDEEEDEELVVCRKRVLPEWSW